MNKFNAASENVHLFLLKKDLFQIEHFCGNLRITTLPPATLSTPIWMFFTLKSILASSTRKYVNPSCWSTGTALK